MDTLRAPLGSALLMTILALISPCGKADAQQTLTIAWDAETNSSAVGYILHYGTTSHTYTNSLNAGTNTTIKVTNLKANLNYYFSVTAYNSAGVESAKSNEILSRTAPAGFFVNQSALTTNSQYLQFNNGTPFGYFTDNAYPWINHQDLGTLYVIDATDGKSGVYFYDSTTKHYLYTNPSVFPSLYDVNLKNWLTYYSDSTRPGHYTTGPRQFYDQTTKQVMAM
jgi:hypothetical protein